MSNAFQKESMYSEKPCSLKPTTSSSMKPALHSQNSSSRPVICRLCWRSRRLSTARNRPSRMASETVDKKLR